MGIEVEDTVGVADSKAASPRMAFDWDELKGEGGSTDDAAEARSDKELRMLLAGLE